MATLLKITLDTRQLKQALRDLDTKAPTVIARALNRTASSANTQAIRAIAKNMGIAQKRVRQNISVAKAYPQKLTATVQARPGGSGVVAGRSKAERWGRIPLLEFHARDNRVMQGQDLIKHLVSLIVSGQGVVYRLPGGRGSAPHAFIARMKSGHVGVFQRLPGAKRLKIVELYGPSVPHVFAQKAILAALKKSGEENLAKNMAHEMKNLLRPGAK
jgi:hypothetical protein